MSPSDFPVKIGLVASLSRPGGNVTGASLFTSELEAKKLALLRELLPSAPLIAMLVNPTNPSAETDIDDVQKAASSVGQRIVVLKASNVTEINIAFESIIQYRADGLLVAHDPVFLSRRDQFVALAARYTVPAIYEFREFVVGGGLMSYGSKITDNYRLAGNYTSRILKGAKRKISGCLATRRNRASQLPHLTHRGSPFMGPVARDMIAQRVRPPPDRASLLPSPPFLAR